VLPAATQCPRSITKGACATKVPPPLTKIAIIQAGMNTTPVWALASQLSGLDAAGSETP
jgi:hypothetical protein